MKVDIRSTSMAEMERLEQTLRLALNRAVEDETLAAEMRSSGAEAAFGGELRKVVAIGNRPAGGNSLWVRGFYHVIRAVDAQLNNAAQVQRASTDAKYSAVAGIWRRLRLAAAGSGGGAHTLQEWFDLQRSGVGLKRILLTLLALAERGNDGRTLRAEAHRPGIFSQR